MSDAVVAPDLARIRVGLSPRNWNGLFVTAETSEVNEVQLEDAAHSAEAPIAGLFEGLAIFS